MGTTVKAALAFFVAAGSKVTHVPYKGMILALNDLLGGQIQLIFGNLSNVTSRNGRT